MRQQCKLAAQLYIHQCKEENQKSQKGRRAWENGEAFEHEEENEEDTEGRNGDDSYDSSFIDDSEIPNDHPPSPKPKKSKKKSKNNHRLYGYLKVNQTANNEMLRSQYKKLSRQWHPDKNPSKEAEEIMKNITMAYRILSDRVERSRWGE